MKITSPTRRSMRRHLIAAIAVVFVLVVGMGGWAATAVISGAVVASGSLVVDTNVKKVQHPTGGIVGELRVRDGDRVHAGDIVVRLDETVTRANPAIVTKGLDELRARKARLESERDGWDTIIFPAQLVARASKVTAEDQLKRIDIRAPQDGSVFQLAVHTVGGVITAGDPIMLIVPEADNLSVEVKVNPQDIDQLQLNQKAILRFSAFNARTTPEIEGIVSRISADISTDQRTGQSYYTIRISLPPEQIQRLGNVKLLPGMPVEAFVQTGDRTMLSYLMKPLHNQVVRAFREK